MQRTSSSGIAIASSVLATVLLLVSFTQLAESANDHPQPEHAFGSIDGWKERSFSGNTDYRLVDDGGVEVLRGHTKGQASIFYKEQDVDLDKTPVVSWSWKIAGSFENSDEKSRAGDDFPARVYVVARVGLLPWDTLAINYVWSSKNALGTTWANPFTDKAMMVVVKSGDADAGKWVTHSRDVASDFETLFGRKIRKIQGYAVMVDGDNTGSEGTAWFGNIAFSD